MLKHSLPATLLSAIVTALPAHADTWGPIEVQENFGNLAITHESSILHNQAVVSLKNGSENPVICEVTFRNGPELPVKRNGTIAPGESSLFSAPLRRKVVKLTVEATCSR